MSNKNFEISKRMFFLGLIGFLLLSSIISYGLISAISMEGLIGPQGPQGAPGEDGEPWDAGNDFILNGGLEGAKYDAWWEPPFWTAQGTSGRGTGVIGECVTLHSRSDIRRP